jgi:hypothetical protein
VSNGEIGARGLRPRSRPFEGKKKRAKTDWADALHLRGLLLIGRLPESWIPPAHILDLRARVRTRHLLSHQKTEWQQRMHAVSRSCSSVDVL